LDDKHSFDFLNNWADEKYAFTLEDKKSDLAKVISVKDEKVTNQGIEFKIQDQAFSVNRFGRHNIYNCAAAISLGLTQDLSLESMALGLSSLAQMPGNFELIDEGQDFKVIIDYAFEPKALGALYDIVKKIPHQKIIHILGSTGGGRDQSRRPLLGKLAGEQADLVIVTNEDPYDEDPGVIIDQVIAGAKEAGKKLNNNLFRILDRRQAIAKAINLAQIDDIVLITGKGCEQAIVTAKNKKISWDDRQVAREELKKIK
jgi:UDP-N-acetylmuramyl tripeptide synthase